MFAGLGGLDLAAEWAFPGSSTSWQLDQTLADVRRRHWPDALQVEADVRTVDPLDLPPIDALCGGFPCTDLSVAGQQAGLDGEKSGLYGEMLRFARALWPEVVVMENVPALLGYRERLEDDWHALGYGLTWVKARALDAGAPHIRRRVFVVAVMGGPMRGVMEAPTEGAWTGTESVPWQTPRPSDGKTGGWESVEAGRKSPGLGFEVQLRPWPTTTAIIGAGSEGYSTDSGRHSGVTLTDAVRPWPTPTARGTGDCPSERERRTPSLESSVRAWPTPTTQDGANNAAESQWDRNSEPLNVAVADRPGRRLNPDWTEALIGLPAGWTSPTGPRLRAERSPRWPRGRYPESWDRSVYWPGYEWEPMRTLPDGEPVRGRPARIRACGNAVVAQQGSLAIEAGLRGPRQLPLFGGAR